jgi:hypothetical protein
MKNIITSIVVLSMFSMFSAQYAMAASTAEVVQEAVEKSTAAEKEKIEATHREFKTTGGKIVVGRDGSVMVYPNGPTTYQRVVLTAATVKKNVVWATVKTYEGAKAADGAVVGTITYPVAVIGDWMKAKPELTKEDVAAFTGKPVESIIPVVTPAAAE